MQHLKKGRRLFKEVLLYIKLLLISAAVGGIVTVIWYFYFREYFRLNPEDTQTMGAIIGGFLVFSAILPTVTLTKVSEQVSEMISARAHDDYESFRLALKKTIHPLIHVVIVMLSLLAIGSVMMAPYQILTTGFFFVFGISFIHCFFIVAAIQLDNPSKGLLKIYIPSDWLKRLEEDDMKEAEELNEELNNE